MNRRNERGRFRNSTENLEASFKVLLRTPGPSGEQVGPGLAEPHEGPAVMKFEPAEFNRTRDAAATDVAKIAFRQANRSASACPPSFSTDPDDVRLRGKTGSHRRRAKPTRLTQPRHRIAHSEATPYAKLDGAIGGRG